MISNTTETPGLFVAADLSTFESMGLDRDVGRDGKLFRKLDAAYFAWLWRTMERVEFAATNGAVTADDFDQLRHRFNGVYFWAIQHIGREALLEAVNAGDRGYVPPASLPLVKRAKVPPPEVVETAISGRWSVTARRPDAGRGRYHFRPWTPALGGVFTRGSAFDSETTRSRVTTPPTISPSSCGLRGRQVTGGPLLDAGSGGVVLSSPRRAADGLTQRRV